ncbi:hypothetical protein BGZ92_001771 [Podila epicladia]|nr:hypothetical protein BGZ92_001771 [Podila epicladia]
MITPPSANKNDTQSYTHGSPHSPHTDPNSSIYAQPENSQEHFISSSSSDYQNLAYSPSSSANAPHTATLQYDSPNPNPQLGNVQLDFIPLPTTRPSAPPQPSTAVPIVEARHEAVPLPYIVPPPPSSPVSVPYPVPPSPNVQQQSQYENVSYVDAIPIDMSKEKYKLSPAAGGSTIFEDLRNPRKKAFWIFNIIALAIIFGVLGATVWKPDRNSDNKSDPGSNNGIQSTPNPTPISSTGSRSPVVPTPVTVSVIPTPVVVPTPVTVPPPPPPPPNPAPQPTSGGNRDAWLAEMSAPRP